MHISTFGHLKPTKAETTKMDEARGAAYEYMHALDVLVPDGSDKTYLMRKLREVAMWVNVAITRLPDGSPRE